jgi:hypothetical protein
MLAVEKSIPKENHISVKNLHDPEFLNGRVLVIEDFELISSTLRLLPIH